MADLADHAYGHALAVLGQQRLAADAARRGLQRGGRSRVAVLGHSRAVALAQPGGPQDGPEPALAPATVTEAALVLASRRPGWERAVVDLEGRHGLTRGGYARALGLSPAEAAARSTEVAESWAAELDPALLAWLGAGDCDELAALLAASPGGTAALDEGQVVAAHAETCALCADRLRAMVSVRSLLAQLPLPAAPGALRSAARAARLRPAVPPPPFGSQRSGLLLRLGAAAAAVALIVAAAVAIDQVVGDDSPGRNDRVEALTARPSDRGSLRLSTATFDATSRTVTLTNTSGRRLKWESSATVPWLKTSPGAGSLAAGAAVEVSLLLGEAPEGEIEGAATFAAEDGSTVSLAGAGTVERAPDVAAHRDGCEVSASAEDEGRVAAVVLHWRVGGPAAPEASDEMRAAGSGYQSSLPANASSWFVTAADARGNVSHTPEEPVAGPAC
jgi:hypothetical protein